MLCICLCVVSISPHVLGKAFDHYISRVVINKEIHSWTAVEGLQLFMLSKCTLTDVWSPWKKSQYILYCANQKKNNKNTSYFYMTGCEATVKQSKITEHNWNINPGEFDSGKKRHLTDLLTLSSLFILFWSYFLCVCVCGCLFLIWACKKIKGA